MEKQHFSVARVATHTKENISKFERHDKRKNTTYSNTNIFAERIPMNIYFKKSESTLNQKFDEYEDLFVKEKLDASLEEQQKENITNKKLLSQYEKRVKDIDNLIQHIYEDNISGKITDNRFATLSLNYEKEQKNLKEKIKELSTTIDKTRQEEIDLTTFIAKV